MADRGEDDHQIRAVTIKIINAIGADLTDALKFHPSRSPARPALRIDIIPAHPA
jgi:hypothetical protein